MRKFHFGSARKLAGKIAAAFCGISVLASACALPPANAAAYPPLRNTTTGMAVSTSDLADEVGMKILEHGGNAVDAAVAMGYALAVTNPKAGNIGGGGFAIIHMADGTDAALDFREKAPLAATRDMYLDGNGDVITDLSYVGYKAVGVPGTVAGMSAMLDKYGTMPLNKLIMPAVELAEKGFIINHHEEITMLEANPVFNQFASSRKYFLKPNGSRYVEGDLFVQKDLGKTLRTIAKEGPDTFYKGKIADLIAKDMAKNGGLITKEDLAQYNAVWREPVKGTYRGYDIVSMCPPSSGGIHVIQILNVMENADVKTMGAGSAEKIHLMAEAMRYAYADRSEYLGDPDFVDMPTEKLLSKEYAARIYNKILPDKATPSSEVKPGMLFGEPTHTTHYSVVDKDGNAVSVTYTLNNYYGCGAAVDGAGFLLNDEMDDFSIKTGVPNSFGLVGTDANAIEPQKRPLSSMSPTIVTKDGKLFMVVGSPGGSRIITTVTQIISNVIDHGMNISEAISYPRIHMQWLPDELRIEKYGLSPDTEAKLKNMGYNLSVQEYMGDANCIMVDNEHHIFYGAHDPRSQIDYSAI